MLQAKIETRQKKSQLDILLQDHHNLSISDGIFTYNIFP